jgi:membrane protease YdiL (CAAX protease family)
MKFLTSKPFLLAEMLALTVGFPLAIMHFHLIRYMLPILWIVAIYCLIVHRKTTGQRLRDVWRLRDITRADLGRMFMMLGISAVFIGAATYALLPEKLFSFVSERPAFWALVMVMYPLISVLPQEIIFRLYFFERYKPIFQSREAMILASGLAFGFAHIIFENWVAPLLCAVGGILFALTYSRKRVLSLVSLEHALYGDFIFTIGLGYYFYHGSVAALQTVAQ